MKESLQIGGRKRRRLSHRFLVLLQFWLSDRNSGYWLGLFFFEECEFSGGVWFEELVEYIERSSWSDNPAGEKGKKQEELRKEKKGKANSAAESKNWLQRMWNGSKRKGRKRERRRSKHTLEVLISKHWILGPFLFQ